MSTFTNESAIGKALLCDSQGSPVWHHLNKEDTDAIADMQDAEEEPMLRDLAA